VFDKLQEEIGELKAEIDIEDNQQKIADEMGDILFASVNLSRHLGVNPEQALRDSNRSLSRALKWLSSCCVRMAGRWKIAV